MRPRPNHLPSSSAVASGIRSTSVVRGVLLCIVAVLLGCVGVAAGQLARPEAPQLSLASRFAIGLAVNLVGGGLLVWLGPRYSRAVVDSVRERPGINVLYGAGLLVAFLGVGLVLALLGPLVLLVYLLAIPVFAVSIVGGVLGTVAAGTVIADLATDATLWHGVAVGSLFVAGMNLIPVLGGVVTFVVGAAGVGAVLRGLLGVR